MWVREQCIYALFTAESNRKVNICGYCSLNSNRKTPTRVKTKKKKRKREQKRKVENVEYKHTHSMCFIVIFLKNPRLLAQLFQYAPLAPTPTLF